MKIFSKEFWPMEEIKNQFVHFGICYVAASYTYIFFGEYWLAIIVGVIPMFLTELQQIIFKHETSRDKMIDHIRDFSFGVLGALSPFVVTLINFIRG